jgi:hypothetical protein
MNQSKNTEGPAATIPVGELPVRRMDNGAAYTTISLSLECIFRDDGRGLTRDSSSMPVIETFVVLKLTPRLLHERFAALASEIPEIAAHDAAKAARDEAERRLNAHLGRLTRMKELSSTEQDVVSRWRQLWDLRRMVTRGAGDYKGMSRHARTREIARAEEGMAERQDAVNALLSRFPPPYTVAEVETLQQTERETWHARNAAENSDRPPRDEEAIRRIMHKYELASTCGDPDVLEQLRNPATRLYIVSPPEGPTERLPHEFTPLRIPLKKGIMRPSNRRNQKQEWGDSRFSFCPSQEKGLGEASAAAQNQKESVPPLLVGSSGSDLLAILTAAAMKDIFATYVRIQGNLELKKSLLRENGLLPAEPKEVAPTEEEDDTSKKSGEPGEPTDGAPPAMDAAAG